MQVAGLDRDKSVIVTCFFFLAVVMLVLDSSVTAWCGIYEHCQIVASVVFN